MKAGSRMSIKLHGLPELQRKLKLLKEDMRKRIVRRGLKAGAEVVLIEARARVPKLSGQVRDSLKVTSGTSRKHGTMRASVQTSKGYFKGEDFYASFLEFGYMKVPTYRGADGRIYSMRRGSQPLTPMAPRPFMRPAFHAKKHQAAKRIETIIRHELNRHARGKKV